MGRVETAAAGIDVDTLYILDQATGARTGQQYSATASWGDSYQGFAPSNSIRLDHLKGQYSAEEWDLSDQF